MITVNCAVLPVNLIESAFFGRERGAFTGSNAQP
ncbi:MAG: sigma 54-interacting transcriptional regulator [Desulfomicrobium sp.]|nr:sigma 54-interacting transcriptional regulator [Desulfomicrobium sp.]